MTRSKTQVKLAFGYFIVAALFGAVLRLFHSVAIPVNYKFIVHAHSHIALLGWVYLALTTLLYKLYLGNLDLDKKYIKLFWFTQLTLVGMLLTFPFMGYALFSIVFSTLFLFASYWFAWFFFKNVPIIVKKTNSYTCIRVALWYLVISSLGPWALGAIMNTLGSESIWYRLAIYFYLHFQYNGWMIMALIGLLLFVMEQKNVHIPRKGFSVFFWGINLGILLSFFLSTLWSEPSRPFYVLGGIGALLQFFALVWLTKNIYSKIGKILFKTFHRKLLIMVGLLLAVKMLLQLLTSLPYFARLAYTYLELTIGYLHWTFLGVVTLGIFLFLDYFKLFRISRKAYFLYLAGFFLTEGLIFYKGIAAWKNFPIFEGYFEALALGSFTIAISLVLLLRTNVLNRHRL